MNPTCIYIYVCVFAPHLCSVLFCVQIKQTQDEEKKQLTALRDLIKSSLQLDQKEVSRPDRARPNQARLD